MPLPTRNQPAVTTPVEVYACPADSRAVVTVNMAALIANKAKLFLTSGGAPASVDTIEPQIEMSLNAVYQNTGLALSAGNKIFVQTDTANSIAVVVWGIEEAA